MLYTFYGLAIASTGNLVIVLALSAYVCADAISDLLLFCVAAAAAAAYTSHVRIRSAQFEWNIFEIVALKFASNC